MHTTAKLVLGLLNTVALLSYLIWLMRTGGRGLFYRREGVLYVLPVLLLFYVFIALFRKKQEPEIEEDEHAQDDDVTGHPHD